MKNRNYSIDFLRLISILAVILIHISNATLDYGNYDLNKLFFSFFLTEAPRFAVPVFFLISGYLLMNHYSNKLNTLTFYKKRFIRILPPYIIWSAIYFVLIDKQTFVQLFSMRFLKDLFTGDASYQLYFIPTILILYLLFPLIIKFEKIFLASRFVIGLTAVVCLLSAYAYYTNPTTLPFYAPFRIAFFNLVPFLAGIYYVKNRQKVSKHKNIFVLLAVSAVSLFFILFEAYMLYYKTNNANFVRNQWRPSVLFYGLSIAPLLVMFYKRFLQPFKKVIYFLSTLSFGVFFVHLVFLDLIWNEGKEILASHIYSLWLDPTIFLLVVTLSFAFSYTVGKIPVVNKLLGVKL